MDIQLALDPGSTNPPLGECWCCGSMDDPERMVHLGNHPEVGICRSCARWGARDRTGPLVQVRDGLRTVRRIVIRRGWHRSRWLGGPLRWIGSVRRRRQQRLIIPRMARATGGGKARVLLTRRSSVGEHQDRAACCHGGWPGPAHRCVVADFLNRLASEIMCWLICQQIRNRPSRWSARRRAAIDRATSGTDESGIAPAEHAHGDDRQPVAERDGMGPAGQGASVSWPKAPMKVSE